MLSHLRGLLLTGVLLPLLAHPQRLDSLHILVDATAEEGVPFTYTTFQSASTHFTDGVTVYIRPGVYWIDDPDDPEVRVGQNGREPFGMTVRCPRLTLVGTGASPHDVVLASQRGQTQGAVGNFTMFDFWTDSLVVENMTMGNYCNVDLVYPKNPRLNRAKRSSTITQAHVGYVHGTWLVARNVRFISRLNLNPLNGASHSYYTDCHFECTDDALNGNAVYRHCDFDLYGQKPFWSTFGKGPLFIDCDFYVKSDNSELYFTKQGGPVTIVDSRYHAPSDSIYIGWTAYPQKWLRCYQRNFSLNGKPYTIGSRQRANTLSPAFLSSSLQEAPFVAVSQRQATLLTGKDTLRLTAGEPVCWRVEPGYGDYLSLRCEDSTAVVAVPTNNSDEMVDFCIIAATADGREAACHATVQPSRLPPPAFTRQPRILLRKDSAVLQYTLSVDDARDDSRVTWYRDSVPVAATHAATGKAIPLQEADKGHLLKAVVYPKQRRSDAGTPVTCAVKVKKSPRLYAMDIDFRQFYTGWQTVIAEGLWTVDGYKPADTAEYDWAFDRSKPMWTYGEGFNGAIGMGLLQAQRGARLMYTPARGTYGDMHLTLQVDPTKTAGQGFGSATGQYMDVCLKFDTRTLTGYGLRIIRTVKHSKAVDFLLVKYEQGTVTPLSEGVSATCYRTGCTISVDFIGNRLTAHVSTTTPPPANSPLPHEVFLTANVPAVPFGGIHIQHTGSCGESTTMLHRLHARWE